jgi:hypothetical protein
MIIVFSNFPIEINKEEVISLVSPLIKRSIFFPFRKKGFIENIDIFSLKNEELELVGIQVLVKIEPSTSASHVVDVLNNKLYKGESIFVRQYHQRLTRNDKRSPLDSDDFDSDVRRGDRRKKDLYVFDEISEIKNKAC